MNFEVDRYSSAWAHIALCADLTWASEPPDDFIVANQRLWAQNCRVNQVLQDTVDSQCGTKNHNDLTGQRLLAIQENGNCSKRSVKDVIPESRLAQFYGNFYYDDIRENCYTCTNDKPNSRYSSNGCENSDLTECWMLPEVEYWFRKLVDNSDRNLVPRRRRQYRMLVDDDLCLRIPGTHMTNPPLRNPALDLRGSHIFNKAINGHRSAASERWGLIETAEEAALEAKIRSVHNIWNQSKHRRPRAPSPPPVSRKIRARRRQPRKLAALAPPPPTYCLDDAQLHCDPTRKFQFDVPRPPQLTDYQRAIGRLSSSVQALMRVNISRCSPYRGTNVSRYAPTGPRPMRYPEKRYSFWWPGKNISPRIEKLNNTLINNTFIQHTSNTQKLLQTDEETKKEESIGKKEELTSITDTEVTSQKEKIIDDGQIPSTSNRAKEDLRNKRLYSTVLSMSAPPINLTPVIRLSQKLAPGLIKLNPKMTARLRPSIDKFEELEKEALEQYKDSDESIDTKFRELEKQAVEQYSTSNSNTSCSSSAEKKSNNENKVKEIDVEEKFQRKNSVDSVVIYSQNFPDLNAKKHLHSSVNLKNFHTPPRGEKKEYRSNKNIRISKDKSKRPASDTGYKSKDFKENHKTMRWALPKKRHLTLCVSDFSSDEDLDGTVSIKDVGPCVKKHLSGKLKMSAHGGGDLHPILRKT